MNAGFAYQRFDGMDWYLVRRVHEAYGRWHPANDNLAGSAVYGDLSTDPLSDSTWSVQFGSEFTQYLLASGDMTMWVTVTKDSVDSSCTDGCEQCVMNVTGSSGLSDPLQYCRVQNAEDPWISAGDHPDFIVYGENRNSYHLVDDALQAGGANVWINHVPPSLVERGGMSCMRDPSGIPITVPSLHNFPPFRRSLPLPPRIDLEMHENTKYLRQIVWTSRDGQLMMDTAYFTRVKLWKIVVFAMATRIPIIIMIFWSVPTV